MLVPMVKVHVIGHRGRLDHTLSALHRLQVLQLIDVTSDSSVRLPPLAVDEDRLREIEDLRFLRARIDALLQLLPAPLPLPAEPVELSVAELAHIRNELANEAPRIEALVSRLDDLQVEQETIPRYVESLRKLLPLVPEFPDLDRYETTALLIESRHAGLLGELNIELTKLLSGNFEIISDYIDPDTLGAVLVFPRRYAGRVQALLGREQLARIHLPDRFKGVPFRRTVAEMSDRLTKLPAEIAGIKDEISNLIRTHADWAAASRYLSRRLDQLGAIRHLGATPHTFVISGWVPRPSVEELQTALAQEIGEEVIVEETPPDPHDLPPVLMTNPAPARPFESLVKLLALPRYGTIDPTPLMMLFFPLFFGMMLGDIVYGAILLGLALWVRRRFGDRAAWIRDLSSVFIFSSAWAIVWGVIYGEFLGDLGHRLFGLEPIWINREEALRSLLLFAIAVGGAHIALGLLLGVWEAARAGRRRQMTERIALLVSLAGLFLIAAVAADRLPDGLMSPAVAATVVGLVILMAASWPTSLLMGPLELLGTVGNILSYLRLGAIGLASVFLARVANELGAAAPLLIGILVAALFHALNLALGAFSPTIQSLRLHYVEFFGKFYEGGGDPFQPFGGEPQTSTQIVR